MIKKLLIFVGLLALTTTIPYAQTTLDDFEGGVSGWVEQPSGAGTTITQISGGADSTSYAAEYTDPGWGKGAEKVYTGIVPTTGNYKVTFWYKNGHTNNPWPILRVLLNGANAVDLGSTAVPSWTAGETGIAALTAGANVTVMVDGNDGVGGGPNSCAFDEFKLVDAGGLPITMVLRPMNNYHVAGTQVITVEPIGGTGTYLSAGFDIGNDGSVEYTDNNPGDGFSYPWVTGSISDGTYTFKVTVTDDAYATGFDVADYIVNNASGRQIVLEDGFENWSGGLPVGWAKVDISGPGAPGGGTNSTVTEETTDVPVGSSCMKVNFTASDYTYRYTMLSPSFDGMLYDYIIWYRGKGGDARMYYFSSADGSTWAECSHGLAAGSSVWTEVSDNAWTPAAPAAYMAVATHKFSAGDGWWDEVKITATVDSSDVGDWDLY